MPDCENMRQDDLSVTSQPTGRHCRSDGVTQLLGPVQGSQLVTIPCFTCPDEGLHQAVNGFPVEGGNRCSGGNFGL